MERERSELQLEKLLISTNDIIGKGSHGIVFKGKFEYVGDSVVEVAVKRLDRFRNKIEVEILRLVNSHPNILRYYATERDNDF